MKNCWLSIVIPAHNCENTIERLLNSIIDQNDSNIEIIISDDQSIDNTKEIINTYKDKLNIKYYMTKSRNIHCPSNTRLDGWKYATGDWVCFIDDDDMFEPNVLHIIKKEIKELEIDQYPVILSSFRDYNYEANSYNLTFDGGTWLHGKFYNRKWLIDNNIDFEENLYTNEDLHFNGLVFATLSAQNKNFKKLDLCTYKWTYNPNSFTRSFDSSKHSLLETYFNDYCHAAIDPWLGVIDKYPNCKNIIFEHCCMMIMYMYFYIQSFKFTKKENYIKENEYLVKRYIEKILDKCNKAVEDIIALIYSDSDFYNEIKKDAEIGSSKFIEIESFYTYITNLNILKIKNY